MGGTTNVISACKEVAPVPITMLQGVGALGLGIASTFGAYGCAHLGGPSFAARCTEFTNHLIPGTGAVVATLL
jgi:hypothetical protein